MMKKILFGLLIFVLLMAAAGGIYYWRMTEKAKPPVSDEDRARLTIMPLPAKTALKDGTLKIDSFNYFLKVNKDGRVDHSLERMFQLLGIEGNEADNESEANLIIDFHHETDAIQKVIEDESYRLNIGDELITLVSEDAYGILRGLETLKQLPLRHADGSLVFPQGLIDDQPRYPWRGIMIDVSRHWIPKEAILRNLDAMAAVKLNVLHWHLSDYQGFRVESKVFPLLHEKGSDNNFYTQDDIREILAYAYDRGIRIVPEFDMPGHATSWFAGYPHLATTNKEYKPDEVFGVLTPVIDPTREEVYDFLDKFIGEMASLFPDSYFHIGGDEVAPIEWDNSPSVQSFMKTNNLKDHHDLQHYFNMRLQQILSKYNKRLVGWDEVMHPELDSNLVVQAWRGQKRLWQAVQAGNNAILSAGYYLDHKLPAGKHYQVDPEILPGAVTITPDTLNWKEWDVKLIVSENVMDSKLVLYGEEQDLRGVLMLMENVSAFEKAELTNNQLTFSFPSDYGEIDVEGRLSGDSINGTMSLAFLSFPFKGNRIGGNDMSGTKAPAIEKINPLSDADKNKILGGEAAMWTEFVSMDNIDTRIWPRTAAIAEKLWSPAVLTKDIPDMYRRLEMTGHYLEQIGAQHHEQQRNIIRQWGIDPNNDAINTFLQSVEEAKYYARFTFFTAMTAKTPLLDVVDAALPESLPARRFNEAVNEFIADTARIKQVEFIQTYLNKLTSNHASFEALANNHPTLKKVIPVSLNLQRMAQIGLEAIGQLRNHQPFPAEQRKEVLSEMDNLSMPSEGIIIAIEPGIRTLISANK